MRRLVLAAFVILGGCMGDSKNDPLYFDNPESAVPLIADMLRAKDWDRLARYYRLEGTDLDRAQLRSGEFFYTEEPPEAAHPAGFWRYKHPFAPGYEFVETRELQPLGQIEVIVAVEIDQGDGTVQRGIDSFLMFRSPEGYQILPGEAPTR